MLHLGLVGEDIGRSLSPAVQGAGMRQLGIAGEYLLVEVPKGDLAPAWPRLEASFQGLNVTAPHKLEAARLARRLSATARRCGSVNTLTFGPEGSLGDSTDGRGFLAALARASAPEPSRAVLLGTGGAARAVALALSEMGTEVCLLGRNRAAGEQLVADLQRPGSAPVRFGGAPGDDLGDALRGAQLLVNATPLGGVGHEGSLPLPQGALLPPGLIVFDLVYWPRRTELGRLAEACGCRVVEGVEMLVEQAALSLSSWTGLEAPLGAMREAALAELEARA